MGLEPTTPCGAPHFQSDEAAPMQSRQMTNASTTSVDSATDRKPPGGGRVTVQPSASEDNWPEHPSERERARGEVQALLDALSDDEELFVRPRVIALVRATLAMRGPS